MMTMKRSFEDAHFEAMDVANCLMLLNKIGNSDEVAPGSGRTFTCKTCSKQFPSFQALGGHRASHKKPRLSGDDTPREILLKASTAKPKPHECSSCGLEFPTGQALGGHMRRHRSATVADLMSRKLDYPVVVPVLKKSNSKRVICLDLNLAPPTPGNDLKLQLGSLSSFPMVS